MQSPDILAMRAWLGLDHSPDEIDTWLGDYISETPNADGLAYDILSAPPEIKTDLFIEFVRMRLGFEYSSARGMSAVESVLLELADRVQSLSLSLSVPDFCKSVVRIDSTLGDRLFLPGAVAARGSARLVKRRPRRRVQSLPKRWNYPKAESRVVTSDLSWPEGLSELWNAWDWCDDQWTFNNQPHLAPIIEDIRRRLRSKES